MKAEVEGKEGFIENSFGDRAIIPKDKWDEVKKMIDEGCYDCVDKFVAGLPKLQDKAQDGSVYPDDPWETDESILAFRKTFVERFGEEPSRDINESQYDYDAAIKAGVRPEFNPDDGLYHWDSQFKTDSHPNRFVDGMDTKYGESAFNALIQTQTHEFTRGNVTRDSEIFAQRQSEFHEDFERAKETGIENDFRSKYGMSVHKWKMEHDSEYRDKNTLSWHEKQKSDMMHGTIGFPVTDVRRNAPYNSQFMYPQLQGEQQAKQSQISNEIIQAALPIPGLNKIGKVPGLLDEALGLAGKALPKTATTAASQVDDIGKGFKSEIDWAKWNKEIPTEASMITYDDLVKLSDDHPIFNNFSKDSWELIKEKKGLEYVNNRIKTKLQNLEIYPSVEKTPEQIALINEAKKDIKDFIISDDWFSRMKKANPELTDAEIKKLQIFKQNTLGQNNINIRGQGSINSPRGGEFVNDPYNPRINIREGVDKEHLRSIVVHELGHSQTHGAKLPTGKGWHEAMENTDMMPKLTSLGNDAKDYIGSSEEIRQRALEMYVQAKRKGLLEGGRFTENTYNKALELVDKNFSDVPAFDNFKFYEKNSLIDYINMFYSTTPFIAIGTAASQTQTKE